jgi:hypothetical protein
MDILSTSQPGRSHVPRACFPTVPLQHHPIQNAASGYWKEKRKPRSNLSKKNYDVNTIKRFWTGRNEIFFQGANIINNNVGRRLKILFQPVQKIL